MTGAGDGAEVRSIAGVESEWKKFKKLYSSPSSNEEISLHMKGRMYTFHECKVRYFIVL